jgi:hypothetical protein
VRFLIFSLLVLSLNVYSSNSLNIAIPNSPSSYQNDRIRADNVECQMAIGSATNVEFGVMGILNQNSPYTGFVDQSIDSNIYNNDFVKDVGVYAKITIPIGAPKERLDCNKLYKLELEKKQLEVLKLKQEINQLRQLKFEE